MLDSLTDDDCWTRVVVVVAVAVELLPPRPLEQQQRKLQRLLVLEPSVGHADAVLPLPSLGPLLLVLADERMDQTDLMDYHDEARVHRMQPPMLQVMKMDLD